MSKLRCVTLPRIQVSDFSSSSKEFCSTSPVPSYSWLGRVYSDFNYMELPLLPLPPQCSCPTHPKEIFNPATHAYLATTYTHPSSRKKAHSVWEIAMRVITNLLHLKGTNDEPSSSPPKPWLLSETDFSPPPPPLPPPPSPLLFRKEWQRPPNTFLYRKVLYYEKLHLCSVKSKFFSNFFPLIMSKSSRGRRRRREMWLLSGNRKEVPFRV